MASEFKTFISRGNVVDLAVGVVIGGAFGKIVSSLVSDVIMPPVGLILGGMDFSQMSLVIKEAVGDTAAVTINYGMFVQNIVDFLIVAASIFLFVKGINKMKKKEDAAPAEPPPPPKQELLLEEIRDLLKK
ncbi:MAG: large-conductance mechanosensitive channel protein MscL [Candidatus Kapabacteria bacterium]|nr:large-conductance mechanosensitive channel protein MscL [Ignavibacteriota bacterium]MCW5885725.1 large-conductance mechanosensitive channel protein MscL [Candidatus Kapabacteria bacterium]